MNKIIINKNAQKQLQKLPLHIVRKLQIWAEQVETLGIRDVRKISGYHDEPLQADRIGQRSVRLSKSYRAFYEVNKHEY